MENDERRNTQIRKTQRENCEYLPGILYFVTIHPSAVNLSSQKIGSERGKANAERGVRKIGLGKGRLSSFPFPLFASVSWQVLLQMAEV